jgi:hypothetical protein
MISIGFFREGLKPNVILVKKARYFLPKVDL